MFVVSDLHIGDQSPRDNLCQCGREAILDSFLDYVADQKGQLVILGDFLELFRYPLDSIIAHRRSLLDRLARMDTVFVPGNHDEELVPLIGAGDVPHPFFEKMSHAFVQHVGNKRFKFMHGHEVDPLITPGIQSIGRMLGAVAYRLEFRQGTCILSNDAITDALLEVGEQALELWSRLTRRMNRALRECYHRMPAEKVTILTRHIRTRRMLGRYYADRMQDLYDVAIVGHTHRAGIFDDWYFNSGSWTGPDCNFLEITPDGSVRVFDWSRCGPRPNNTMVAA
ncbi:MAG TPA: metallophosphoesterase [Sedimentisphaerales bacterium]|nr:metallophosphoesterase [Sedimentisphaerales bacterium]HNU31786.1 metallophosphoesterase [Sedimentisphaerales bacterium]